MANEFKTEKINWRTKSTYVDIETGEQLTKEQVVKDYNIINKKTKSHVYRSTGTKEIINECRKSRQGKLF